MAYTLEIREGSEEIYAESLERQAKCADFILQTLASENLTYGDLDNGKDYNYNEISEKIINYISENGVRYVDISGVFRMLLQPLTQVKDRIEFSANKAFENASEKLFGKKIEDLDYKNLLDIVRD